MQASRIVGSSRVIQGETQRAPGSSKQSVQQSRIGGRIGKSRRDIPEPEPPEGYMPSDTRRREAPPSQRMMRSGIQPIPTKGVGDVSAKLKQRVVAVQATTLVFWTAIPFWIPQICFWMLGIAGLGMESIPWLNYVLPGVTLFWLGEIIIVAIGVCTMTYAALILGLRGVNCFGGLKGLVFALCVAGYCAPIANFFPWFVLWLAAIVYLQGKPKNA